QRGEDRVHCVIVPGLALRAVRELQMPRGVSHARRRPDLRDPAAEVDSVAAHAQAPGRLGPHQDFPLLRRPSVVVERPELRHSPKSNPSRSLASSPTAPTCSCAAARNAPISPPGRNEIRLSWWGAVRTAYHEESKTAALRMLRSLWS